MDASEKLASQNYPPPHQVSVPDVSDQEVAEMTEPQIKLTLGQRIVLAIRGRVYLNNRIEPGWTRAIPFYAFRCRVHGLVESRPFGYGEVLKCPDYHRPEGVD